MIDKQQLHAYRFAMDTKPVKAIAALHDALREFGKAFSLKTASKMKLSKDKSTAFIVLLNEGCCSVNHADNDQYIVTFFAPTVIGLLDGYGLYYDVPARPQHYIRAETNCSGWVVPLDIFVEKCDELSLWHDVSRFLAQRLMVMSAREYELVGNDAYGKIRALLQEIWLYPEEFRSKLLIAAFIQRRAKLSRSRVMNILSVLKQGGYIEIEAGVLTSMKKLPLSF
jgi:HD superfamily phosphohydrolase YqeK